jgi:apolipoprotein D and lipocalin family protein
MKKSIILLLLLHVFIAAVPGYRPVNNFEIEKYSGTWHEIARLPFFFEDGLSDITATYQKNEKGSYEVINRGTKKNGQPSVARGIVKFAGDQSIGHLKVSFFGPFFADYIITELDKQNYSYALIAGSSLKNLWILSRTTTLPKNITDKLLIKAHSSGFDTTQLIWDVKSSK